MTRVRPGAWNRLACGSLTLLAALALSACGGHAKKSPVAVSDTSAVTFQPITGTGLERITLSPRAAYRLGIQTGTVARASGKLTKIPYSAVMYAPDGTTYTYISPSSLTFVRTPISVARLSTNLAYLSSGPGVGTKVVTVGSAELLGTEEGVQDEEGTLRKALPAPTGAKPTRR